MRQHVHSPIFLLFFTLLLLSVLDSCSVFQTPTAPTNGKETTSTGTKPSRARSNTARRGTTTQQEGVTAKSGNTRTPVRRSRRPADEEMEADAKPVTYNTASNTLQLDYIKLYKDAAVMEMNQGGIPASIILAQGLIESAAGQSDLAKNANNHFGIKCAGSWTGRTMLKQDDDKDEDGKPIKSCFRVYTTVAEGFHDHGEFLRDPKKHNRYGFLFNLDKTDYKSWARGLQSAGYATSQTYATQLIDIIERFKIYEYDRPNATAGVLTIPGTDPTSTGAPNPNKANPNVPDPNNPNNVPVIPPAQRIGRVNDVKVVLSRPGETLDDVAKLYQLNTLKVADYNDRGYTPGIKLKENTRVFIQAKRDRWRGRATEHFVRDDQTMFDISQLYGIQLEKLLSRNGLRNGQEPAVGQRLILKGTRRKGDNVSLRDASTIASNANSTSNSTTYPTPTAPVTQSSNAGKTTVIVNDDELFEIQGNQTSIPLATTPQTLPPVTTPPPAPIIKPSVSDLPYPNDPVPQTGNNGMQQPTTTYPPTTVVTPPPVSVGSGYHVVVKGDTLYNISRKYNLTLAQLKQLNNMSSDENIRIGQTLRVK